MNKTTLTIDSDLLDMGAHNSHTFKGFGLLSCNNSSRLLMDYRIEHPDSYQEMLHIMFGGRHPLMKLIKVELGNDANTYSGTEPATKRSINEPANVIRGAGYQLIADAKQINPAIKTCLLRWGEPGYLRKLWAGIKGEDPNNEVDEQAYEPMYQLYKQTIIAAYQQYGYLFDYVNPDRNENIHPMYRWIKWFANRIKNDRTQFPAEFPIHRFNQIKIIAADQNYETNFGEGMMHDVALREAVDAVGYHYNTDDGPNDPYTKLADEYQHEVWYSEGIAPMTMGKYRVKATNGDGIGGKQSGLDIANRLIKGYVKSRRSCYIFQPAISAYYPGVNYSHKELINASHPWSGFFEVDNVGLQIMRHFTNFAVTGWNEDQAWRYLTSACDSGVGGTENLNHMTQAASYITLMAPNKKNYSVVFVNDSSEPREYTVKLKNIEIQSKTLYLWRSTGSTNASGNYDDSLMQCREQIKPQGQIVSLIVYPHSIVTATTLDLRDDSEVSYSRIESKQANTLLCDDAETGILYHDDFNYSKDESQVRKATPRYMTDQGGAFEIVESRQGKVLQQQITEPQRALDWEYSYAPNLTFGDDRWNDYEVQVKLKFDTQTQQNSPTGNYFGIGIYQQTDVKGKLESAPYVVKVYTDGLCQLFKNSALINETHLDEFDIFKTHVIALGAKGNHLQAKIDDHSVFEYVDLLNAHYSGRIKLGTGYYKTEILDVLVKKNDKVVQYQRIDDLDDQIKYHGDWNHVCGLENTIWNRTLSYGSSGKYTRFEFDFRGSGFYLLGKQRFESRLSITVDGQLINGSLLPQTVPDKTENVMLKGLTNVNHHVSVGIVEGTYTLDAIGFLKRPR